MGRLSLVSWGASSEGSTNRVRAWKLHARYDRLKDGGDVHFTSSKSLKLFLVV